jgi:soluble P-type ATPase
LEDSVIKIEIPGREPLEICHLVLDYNGTIAVDGLLLRELAEPIEALSRDVDIHILTADTYGTVAAQCAGLCAQVCTFPQANAGSCKAEIVRSLGGGVACMGNGFNDIPMFEIADLAIAVLLEEGTCAALLPHADVLVRSALDGFHLLLKPNRLKADLRN